MDAGTAAKHGFRVGDRVRVLLQRRRRKEFRIVGLFGVRRHAPTSAR